MWLSLSPPNVGQGLRRKDFHGLLISASKDPWQFVPGL